MESHTTESTTKSPLKRAADAIRVLSAEAVQQAKSGHPGMPMGMADAAVTLWSKFLKYDPSRPDWSDRDRFVLSAGHGSMLLYSVLHLTGYDVELEDLRQFRQWESKTPGHPERWCIPGVETTTGPLAQGFSNAVGFAVAERHLAARFNRPGHSIVDHFTYVIAGDGDMMEGLSAEAASLAGHLKLGRLIVLYDDNQISIDGSTELAFTENVGGRFEAQNWHVQVVDGHDEAALAAAIQTAQQVRDKPSLIRCQTLIGFGSPNKEGTAAIHGAPLGDEELQLTKENLGWTNPPFTVPDEVYQFMRAGGEAGAAKRAEWEERFALYRETYPDLAEAFEREQSGVLPEGWDKRTPAFPEDKALATRAASGKTLEVIKPQIPNLIGGSADLTPSNNTHIPDDEDLTAENYGGRYIRFGVREHAMAAIMNGISIHGGLRIFGGTFLIFSDYMRHAVRLAGVMHAPTIFVFTHDSVGLGEDGPTHQPVEQLAGLRAIPNLVVIRPADAAETAAAWKVALRRTEGPTALIFTRQGAPDLPSAASEADIARGAYIVAEQAEPDVILLATGSEVLVALGAREKLAERGFGARVVSMPSWRLFDAQPEDYRQSVLPSDVRARVSVEALSSLGWERYVGLDGATVSLDAFGKSAPSKTLFEKYGFTPENVADVAERVVNRQGGEA